MSFVGVFLCNIGIINIIGTYNEFGEFVEAVVELDAKGKEVKKARATGTLDFMV